MTLLVMYLNLYRYCFRIAESYPLASAAPLLCAGITVYSPMIRHKMNQPGKSLGVIGLGGLGHLAVKFGKAFGLNVTVFSTSTSKKEESLTLLGADNFVVSSDQEKMKVEMHKPSKIGHYLHYVMSCYIFVCNDCINLHFMQAMAKSLDFIIDTVSADHSFDMYMSLLKTAGVLVMVGAPNEVKLSPMSLILGTATFSLLKVLVLLKFRKLVILRYIKQCGGLLIS